MSAARFSPSSIRAALRQRVNLKEDGPWSEVLTILVVDKPLRRLGVDLGWDATSLAAKHARTAITLALAIVLFFVSVGAAVAAFPSGNHIDIAVAVVTGWLVVCAGWLLAIESRNDAIRDSATYDGARPAIGQFVRVALLPIGIAILTAVVLGLEQNEGGRRLILLIVIALAVLAVWQGLQEDLRRSRFLHFAAQLQETTGDYAKRNVAFVGPRTCTVAARLLSRDEQELLATKVGLTVHSRWTKEVHVLVVPDVSAHFGTVLEARKHGTCIVPEHEFWSAVGVSIDGRIR